MASKSETDRYIVSIDVKKWKEIASLLFYIAVLAGFVYGWFKLGYPPFL